MLPRPGPLALSSGSRGGVGPGDELGPAPHRRPAGAAANQGNLGTLPGAQRGAAPRRAPGKTSAPVDAEPGVHLQRGCACIDDVPAGCLCP
jgi:hypothetical protein